MRKLRSPWIVLLVIVAILPGAAASAADSADELAGLWKAKRWFGPFARGSLLIQRTGTTYTADIIGKILPVHAEKGELSFDLPNGQGSFRGKLQTGDIIQGHWFPPDSLSGKYASPVQLKRDGPNRWSGQVVPFEDFFTFYLLARKRPDGSLGVFLRNPERDLGAWLGVDRLVRDGNAVKLIGTRPGQKEEKELAGGTYDADNQVITLTFPSRGGTYDFHRDDEQSDFYPRGKNPDRYVYHPPPARDDGWPTGTLEEVGIDRPAIERFIQKIIDTPMESVDTPEIHAFLIARHGKLVLEEYFPVYQVMNGGTFPADLEPRKQAMTLEHLLTMSSGYFCDDTNPDAPGGEEIMSNQTDEPDYYRFTLKVPMASAPGEKAVYCSSNPNLALGVVGRGTGEFPLDLFDRLLGAPMKITRYGWPLDPVGHPYGGGGAQFLPRDFMKFGQLMLNGGTWQGRRLLARDFVTRASSPLYHLRGIYYGYLWWGIDYPYKNRTVHAYFAGGAGGQGVMVIPELDLVIASFAGNYSSKGSIDTQQNLTPRYILPAVREPGDDKNAPVIPREDYVTPYGRSPVSGPVSK
jgi:hypothetical protein